MYLSDISAIKILPDRQRQEFNPSALQDLIDSILSLGLLHPIVVREGDDGEMILVAGERRLRAIAQIHELGLPFKCNGTLVPEGQFPFTTLGQLKELEAEEAELDENFRRKDLTWQELASAQARLHRLRTAQQEERIVIAKDLGLPYIPKPHTIADTALELTGRSDGAYQGKVREAVIIANHLSDPDVQKAKTQKEAVKVLKRKEELKKSAALAETVGRTFSSSIHQVINGDCLEFMAAHKDLVDVILTDPPYGMDAHKFGDGAGKLTGITHNYEDSKESWLELMTQFAPLSYSITKEQAHLYCFCDPDNFHHLRDLFTSAGWYVFRTPLINHKLNSGRVPLPEHGPRRQYETVLYAFKGKKKVTAIYSDVFSTNSDENLSHGAQKPVAVYENLLQRSVKPGDVILDPFAGTGPIFPAAHAFKCKAIGVEKNPEYYGLCLGRLETIRKEENLEFDFGFGQEEEPATLELGDEDE